MTAVRLQIWSDIACPWCWVGKRHLEQAINASTVTVEIEWRAFELDQHAPVRAPQQVDYAERLARKYQCSSRQAQAMIDRMVGVGDRAGLELRFDRIRPSSTFDAHRLLAWASGSSQTELKERMFSAYLREGLSISDHRVLTNLAAQVGLDAERANNILAGTEFAEQVRADESAASSRGVTGVPYFLIDQRSAIAGAQPPEVFLRALASR